MAAGPSAPPQAAPSAGSPHGPASCSSSWSPHWSAAGPWATAWCHPAAQGSSAARPGPAPRYRPPTTAMSLRDIASRRAPLVPCPHHLLLGGAGRRSPPAGSHPWRRLPHVRSSPRDAARVLPLRPVTVDIERQRRLVTAPTKAPVPTHGFLQLHDPHPTAPRQALLPHERQRRLPTPPHHHGAAVLTPHDLRVERLPARLTRRRCQLGPPNLPLMGFLHRRPGGADHPDSTTGVPAGRPERFGSSRFARGPYRSTPTA